MDGRTELKAQERTARRWGEPSAKRPCSWSGVSALGGPALVDGVNSMWGSPCGGTR